MPEQYPDDFQRFIYTSLTDIRERVTRVEEKVTANSDLEDRVSALERKNSYAAGKQAGYAALFSFISPMIRDKLGLTFLP